jgi:tRNA-Thr(GGU) m(6)t(6)A37 methyltransferase TsaA
MDITYTPIGIIQSPFTRLEDMPIQPTGESSGAGWLEIFPQFVEGLKDLDGFSHLYILYHLHQVRQAQLTVTPFLDSQPHGIFATRAPTHPNPIGLSLVKLLWVEGNRVHVNRVDVLDGTPLLDIKPYIPEFEEASSVRTGWLEGVKGRVKDQRSDERFK